MIKDLVIIGGGPAGLSAAIYASRQKTDFRLISRDIGGQAVLSSSIENYSGYQVVSGETLVKKFEKQASSAGADIKEGVEVRKLERDGEIFKVHGSDGECCRARTLIIATGARPRKLGVEGEDKFRGKGIAYCAICDAPLFSGKDVAVIGGGNSALYAAAQLIKLKCRIYLITENKKMGGERILREKVLNSDRVELIVSGQTAQVRGDKMLDSIIVNIPSGERKLSVEGVFVETGRVPASDLIPFVQKNKKQEIIIDALNRASVKGVYAAGDVSSVSKKQVVIAAGEGAKASLNAIDYIEGG